MTRPASRFIVALASVALVACNETTPTASSSPEASVAGTAGLNTSQLPSTINPMNKQALLARAAARAAATTGKSGQRASFSVFPVGVVPGVISNGLVMLGVTPEGALNVEAGYPTSTLAPDASGTLMYTTVVGLRYVPLNDAATEDGCTCEGWGVADAISGVWGGRNTAYDANPDYESHPPVVESFVTTNNSAVSTVKVGSTYRVTHDYHPSAASPNLFEVTVTLENISGAPVHAIYRRSVDWDIEPTPFAEYVTLRMGTSPRILRMSDNPFNSANPLRFTPVNPFYATPSIPALVNVDTTNEGPRDLGALFDFDFGMLAAGSSRTFHIYYGAAADNRGALVAMAQAGVEAYSTATVGTPAGKATGAPNTFMFAFKDIEGSNVLAPVVTPTITGTLALDGSYTSDVSVTWSVTSRDAAITSTSGCSASTLSVNGTVTYTCSATNDLGLTTTRSVTVRRAAPGPQTLAELCTVTRQLVDQHGIANSLCQKLDAAAAAQLRGSTKAAGNILDAYIAEVRAQTGKWITAPHAALLIQYAQGLKATLGL